SDGFRDGKFVRKSGSSQAMPFTTTSTMRTSKTSSPKTVARKNRTLTRAAVRRRARRRGSKRCCLFFCMPLIHLLVLPDDRVGHHVQAKRNQEQHEADGEQALVADGALRRIPQADLHNVG